MRVGFAEASQDHCPAVTRRVVLRFNDSLVSEHCALQQYARRDKHVAFPGDAVCGPPGLPTILRLPVVELALQGVEASNGG